MKIVLFIDSSHLLKSSCYTLFSLLDNLNINFSYKIQLYVSGENKKLNYYIDKKFALSNRYNINWTVPKQCDIDILLLVHWCRNINNTIDIRNTIIKESLDNNKYIIVIKSDTTMEYCFINDKILYGVNSEYNLYVNNGLYLPPNVNKFIFPSLNLSLVKPNYLSREKYYEKYKLNPKLRLVVFILGRNNKWLNIRKDYTKSIYWFITNIKKINKILNSNGFQLVFKLHRFDSKHDFKILDKCKIIDHEHIYETIKYSEYAISYGTTMIYELYLYNLPVLEIGEGIYFPKWFFIYNKNKIKHNKKIKIIDNNPLNSYNKGIDLIFGRLVSYKKLSSKTSEVLGSFLNTKYNIDEYKYLKDNPIYGNSYYDNIDTISVALSNQFNKIKLSMKK
jgi:hypothetical protein